jgi:hypothetical protein
MVLEHRIASFSGQSQVWTEPEFVQTAHDTGTELAIEFVSELRENHPLLEKFKQKPDWFLFHYLLLTLQKSNFNIPSVWGDMRESLISDEEIGRLTHASAKILLTAITETPPTPSFLERVIHTFQNCTTQQHEQQIANRFFVFLLWKQMSDSWKNTEIAGREPSSSTLVESKTLTERTRARQEEKYTRG